MCTVGRRSGSGSAWRSTSRVTGAMSPSPEEEVVEARRPAGCLRSTRSRRAESGRSGRAGRAGTRRSRWGPPGSRRAARGGRRPPTPLHLEHVGERPTASPDRDLEEEDRIAGRQVVVLALSCSFLLVLRAVAAGRARLAIRRIVPRLASAMNLLGRLVQLDPLERSSVVRQTRERTEVKTMRR